MKTGTPTGTVYVSPRRKQARARRRRREEQRWAARSGPVTVTYREILPNNREILPTSRGLQTISESDLRKATDVDNLQVEVEGSRLGCGVVGVLPKEINEQGEVAAGDRDGGPASRRPERRLDRGPDPSPVQTVI